MQAAKILAWVGFISMIAALAYGFGLGDGWSEVATLVSYPWFNVSLVDVYVGFALFSGWIVFRERRPGVAAAWIVAIVLLGNLVTCLYAILALHRCGGEWGRFWLGARVGSPGASAG